MHDLENEQPLNAHHWVGQKNTYWNMTENTHLENKRTDIAGSRIWQKGHTLQMLEITHPENGRIKM